MGESEGGPLGILFAAAHPGADASAHPPGWRGPRATDEDWPWGESTVEQFEASIAHDRRSAGARGRASAAGPVDRDDPGLRRHRGVVAARSSATAATPAAWEAFCPDGVRHRRSRRRPVDPCPDPDHPRDRRPGLPRRERALARREHPRARVRRDARADHLPSFHPDRTLAEIREFITGSREPEEPDRVLATILFTDIVGSTELATQLGDRAGATCSRATTPPSGPSSRAIRGREVDTAGDGFLAVFDGPARAIRAANAIVQAVRPPRPRYPGRYPHRVRSSSCPSGDIRGIAVHTGRGSCAPPVRGGARVVLGARPVAGSGFTFVDRGTHVLKGVGNGGSTRSRSAASGLRRPCGSPSASRRPSSSLARCSLPPSSPPRAPGTRRSHTSRSRAGARRPGSRSG